MATKNTATKKTSSKKKTSKKKTSTKATPKDLGTLKLKQAERVILLPTDAKGVIVNYSNQSLLRVTCSFDETSHKVKVGNGRNFTIKTPPLLFSAQYVDTPTSKANNLQGFSIFGYYPKARKYVWAAPYNLANVHANGRICFGTLHPKDLRAAYNLFWEAGFNNHLNHYASTIARRVGAYIDTYDTRKLVKGYQKKLFDKQDWEDYTPEICGTKYLTIKNPSDALLLTRSKELLKQIPKEYWLKQGRQAFMVFQAKRYSNFWAFATNDVMFRLPLNSVATKSSWSY